MARTRKQLFRGLVALLAAAVAAVAAPARAEDPVYEFGVLPQVATAKLAEQWVPFLDKLSEASGVKLKFVTAPTISDFGTRAAAGSYAFYYHNTLAYVQQDDKYTAFAREVGARTKGVLVVSKSSKVSKLSDLTGGTGAMRRSSRARWRCATSWAGWSRCCGGCCRRRSRSRWTRRWPGACGPIRRSSSSWS